MLSDLRQVVRFDAVASSKLLKSGHSGSWVNMKGDKADLLADVGDLAIGPIWVDSSSPPWVDNKNITVFSGQHRALTTEYVGSPEAGQALFVDSSGRLTTDIGNGFGVAICTKAPFTSQHLGQDSTVIEYITNQRNYGPHTDMSEDIDVGAAFIRNDNQKTKNESKL